MNKEFIWCDSLLNNSKRIVQDSMWVILDEQKKLYREKIDNALLNKDTASLMKIHYEHPMIYGFSKPIYLRDNTICLLYFIALWVVPVGTMR